jgi:hypothetical protein
MQPRQVVLLGIGFLGQEPNLYLSYPQRNPLPITTDSLYLQLASGSTDPRSRRPTHYLP